MGGLAVAGDLKQRCIKPPEAALDPWGKKNIISRRHLIVLVAILLDCMTALK